MLVMHLETCVAHTLDQGHAVGEMVGEDCIRHVVGLHVLLELLGHYSIASCALHLLRFSVTLISSAEFAEKCVGYEP